MSMLTNSLVSKIFHALFNSSGFVSFQVAINECSCSAKASSSLFPIAQVDMSPCMLILACYCYLSFHVSWKLFSRPSWMNAAPWTQRGLSGQLIRRVLVSRRTSKYHWIMVRMRKAHLSVLSPGRKAPGPLEVAPVSFETLVKMGFVLWVWGLPEELELLGLRGEAELLPEIPLPHLP